MRPQFRELRLNQLERLMEPFLNAKSVPRPHNGWLRAVREATGLTLQDLGERLGTSHQLVSSFEKSEQHWRISLSSLRDAADAMGCALVYAIVPKEGTLHELVERRARAQVEEDLTSVEQTMALEDQAVGRLQERIDQHTKRRIKRG